MAVDKNDIDIDVEITIVDIDVDLQPYAPHEFGTCRIQERKNAVQLAKNVRLHE